MIDLRRCLQDEPESTDEETPQDPALDSEVHAKQQPIDDDGFDVAIQLTAPEQPAPTAFELPIEEAPAEGDSCLLNAGGQQNLPQYCPWTVY